MSNAEFIPDWPLRFNNEMWYFEPALQAWIMTSQWRTPKPFVEKLTIHPHGPNRIIVERPGKFPW